MNHNSTVNIRTRSLGLLLIYIPIIIILQVLNVNSGEAIAQELEGNQVTTPAESLHTALKYSIFIPGKGQYYQGRGLEAGRWFGLGILTTIGPMIYSIKYYNKKAEEYNKKKAEYLEEGSYLKITTSYKNAESAEKDANIAKMLMIIGTGAFSAIYIWNIIDVIDHSPKNPDNSKSQISTKIDIATISDSRGAPVPGISVNYTF